MWEHQESRLALKFLSWETGVLMLPEIETVIVFRISMMCRFPSSYTGLIGRIHPDVSITVSEAECVSYGKNDSISFQVSAYRRQCLVTLAELEVSIEEQAFTSFDMKISYFIFLLSLPFMSPEF